MSAKECLPSVIIFYYATEWDRWRTSCDDGAIYFAIDFKTSEYQALAAFREYAISGRPFYPVSIQIDCFLEWARENSRPTTEESRCEYASLLALQPEN